MNLYIVGIGGAGLSALAQLALDCGYNVTGSDIAPSLGTQAVENRGVFIDYEQSAAAISRSHHNLNIDWVIYTSACSEDNPQLIYAREQGIKTTKRDDFLNYVLQAKNLKLIAVAGTHGKTTTTAMIVWTMQQLGVPVSYLIGSNISFGPSSRYQEGSEYFVLEADEYDRNFLKFSPYISLITNIDYDHPDIYPSKQEYYDAFCLFAKHTQSSLIIWKDSYDRCINCKFQDNLKIYSFDKVSPQNKEYLSFISLAGNHNRENAFLAISAMSLISTIDSATIAKHMNTFPGTQRRFEKLKDNLYSDYAHHPSEIRATLQMASEISESVVTIYQPHQNTRQHEVLDEYRNIFDHVKHVYWLDTFLSREKKDIHVITPSEFIDKLSEQSKLHTTPAKLDDDLIAAIHNYIQNGHLVVVIGAGSIDEWARTHLV